MLKIIQEAKLVKRFTLTIGIGLALALAAYTLICAVHLMDFPSEIRLTENTQHRLVFSLPFSATIQPETATALRVNHAPIEETVQVNLQDPLWIEAGGSGRATMTLSAFGVPVKDVTLDILPTLEVIPVGVTVGVRINTHGVMVLGTGAVMGADGQMHNPSEGKLRPGDLIISANGRDLSSKQDLMTVIAESGGSLTLQIKRDKETLEAVIVPVKCAKSEAHMIGSWVRDSTQGIGTVTFLNPETKAFGALGHGIMDVDTKKLMSVKEGHITAARITSVKKGSRGTPGELVGEIEARNVLGQITVNSPLGIYGVLETIPENFPTETLRAAKQDQIQEGPAAIRTNIVENTLRDFDIYIESVNRFTTDETKGMIIRITDPELLKVTNGIVQGMSGSPIIQNEKLVGAVTHVFVQDPTKGYGIFIEHMLRVQET